MLILGIETSCDETAASLIEVHPVKSRKAGTPKELFDGVKKYGTNTGPSSALCCGYRDCR